MTTPRLAQALQLYSDMPLDAGDAVLFLDDQVALEVTGLADHWDAVGSARTVQMLQQNARSVVLAIARPRAQLLPGDVQIGQDLARGLRDTGVALLSVEALPAA